MLIPLNVWAETSSRTFFLGVSPEPIKTMIKFFLSKEGIMHSTQNGSIEVKDKVEVLDKIDQFIKDNAFPIIPRFHIAIHYSDSRHSHDKELGESPVIVRSITANACEKAMLSIQKTESQLSKYRSRFISNTLSGYIEDEFYLQVSPIRVGSMNKVTLKSIYRAIVEGEEKTYETGELNASVVTRSGQWVTTDGKTRGSESKDNMNKIQNLKIKEGESCHVRLMVQVLQPTEIPFMNIPRDELDQLISKP